MTHSYEEIIRLDSQRAQGEWHLDNVCQHGVTIYTKDGLLAKVWSEMDSPTKSNAQYIAAMPDAVGLLREYRAMLERAKKWFDMAVTYKMEVAEGGCNQYKIATINGWQAPDLPALITELQRLVGEKP